MRCGMNLSRLLIISFYAYILLVYYERPVGLVQGSSISFVRGPILEVKWHGGPSVSSYRLRRRGPGGYDGGLAVRTVVRLYYDIFFLYTYGKWNRECLHRHLLKGEMQDTLHFISWSNVSALGLHTHLQIFLHVVGVVMPVEKERSRSVVLYGERYSSLICWSSLFRRPKET